MSLLVRAPKIRRQSFAVAFEQDCEFIETPSSAERPPPAAHSPKRRASLGALTTSPQALFSLLPSPPKLRMPRWASTPPMSSENTPTSKPGAKLKRPFANRSSTLPLLPLASANSAAPANSRHRVSSSDQETVSNQVRDSPDPHRNSDAATLVGVDEGSAMLEDIKANEEPEREKAYEDNFSPIPSHKVKTMTAGSVSPPSSYPQRPSLSISTPPNSFAMRSPHLPRTNSFLTELCEVDEDRPAPAQTHPPASSTLTSSAGVWLCSKPKSPVSATTPTPINSFNHSVASLPLTRQRPIITRSMSSGRLDAARDENGMILCISSHCGRVLRSEASVSTWNERHLGLGERSASDFGIVPCASSLASSQPTSPTRPGLLSSQTGSWRKKNWSSGGVRA
ncbi:hypothetical protein P7C73_g173, partial [Tremellales sp. Uapishka_1]